MNAGEQFRCSFNMAMFHLIGRRGRSYRLTSNRIFAILWHFKSKFHQTFNRSIGKRAMIGKDVSHCRWSPPVDGTMQSGTGRCLCDTGRNCSQYRLRVENQTEQKGAQKYLCI